MSQIIGFIGRRGHPEIHDFQDIFISPHANFSTIIWYAYSVTVILSCYPKIKTTDFKHFNRDVPNIWMQLFLEIQIVGILELAQG